MCNQSVGLIAAEAERRGIATVCLQLLEGIAESMGIPRALLVPYPHGYALGEPGNPVAQHAVLAAALALLTAARGPVVRRLG
ncbi:MAG: hypothetical protein P8R54_03760 [Myxococcota bacterium]|nr:hypothetical protein [Myxococcota bacterium]